MRKRLAGVRHGNHEDTWAQLRVQQLGDVGVALRRGKDRDLVQRKTASTARPLFLLDLDYAAALAPRRGEVHRVVHFTVRALVRKPSQLESFVKLTRLEIRHASQFRCPAFAENVLRPRPPGWALGLLACHAPPRQNR